MNREILSICYRSVVIVAFSWLVIASAARPLAEEAMSDADLKSGIAELEEAAKQPDVQEDLEEPDGVALDDLDAENWKIFAIGTGTFEFNDAEERKDAVAEATMEAKAALAKFMKERLSTESQLDLIQANLDLRDLR